MKEKLQYLLQVRDCMDNDIFKFATASVIINYFSDELKNQGKSMNYSKLLLRVNLSLRAIGVDEISYGFLRDKCS